MKPFTVSTTVDRPIEEVWDYLDVLGNHEQFTDHMLQEWTTSGPDRGVGAKARVKAKSPGRTETLALGIWSRVQQGDDAGALVLCAASFALAFGAMLVAELWLRRASGGAPPGARP